MRTLILFLKDFCREAWTANRAQGEALDGACRMLESVRQAMEEIRFPVTRVNGKTGDVTLDAADVGALTAEGTAHNAQKLDGKTWAAMMLEIYPVGSVYLAADPASPASLFGGTWEQIKDRFLLGAGGAYAGGETGGTAEETLSIEQIPPHSHEMYARSAYAGGGTYIAVCNKENSTRSYATGDEGGGQAHNNMPPYLAVYIWKRVS